jgi:hypothetical protein
MLIREVESLRTRPVATEPSDLEGVLRGNIADGGKRAPRLLEDTFDLWLWERRYRQRCLQVSDNLVIWETPKKQPFRRNLQIEVKIRNKPYQGLH